MEIRMMNRKEVIAAFGTSEAGLHRGMIKGIFPRPYRTGDKSVRWKSDEVQAAINAFQIAVPVEVCPGIKKGRKPRNFTEVGV